jgi:hypothetical protein
MAREKKSDREIRIHGECLREFDHIVTSQRDERQQALGDRRFYSIAGAQWEGPLGEQFENKPKFEVNKIHLAVIRIFNEYRANRISVTFRPKDGATGDEWADKVQSLFRADEEDSNAQEAYDNAFEEAVGGGIGALRVRACEEDEYDDENDHQRIRIEPIFDADSTVFFDLNSRRQDKADAKSCYVLTPMTRDAYIETYDDDPASWPKEITLQEFDWAPADVVYVAEVYRVEEKAETLHIFRSIDGSEERYSDEELDDDEGKLRKELQAAGSREVRQKRVTRKKVHKWIMSGGGILEDCGFIAGRCIPVIPVYGKRWIVDNIERVMGHVRLAKDAQRLKNMQLSRLAEISAMSAVEKPILLPEQVTGHEVQWAQDNRKNYPYLLVNPITNGDGSQTIAGPTAYTKVPNIPPAMAAALQITEQDMADILGKSASADEVQSNVSGRTVEMVQQRLDMQAFIYMSNFARALKRLGEVWLSMARDVYVEEGRKMKTIAPDGAAGQLELKRPMVDDDGAITTENDFEKASFDVVVDVGPSSQSRRAATVRAVTQLLAISDDPTTRQVLTSVAIANMEGEGLSDVRDYFRKQLVQAGVMKPTEEEEQAMAQAAANAQPDPNQVLAQSLAEEATAKAAKARADTVLTVANAEKARADTARIEAETLKTVAELDAGSRGQFSGG